MSNDDNNKQIKAIHTNELPELNSEFNKHKINQEYNAMSCHECEDSYYDSSKCADSVSQNYYNNSEKKGCCNSRSYKEDYVKSIQQPSPCKSGRCGKKGGCGCIEKRAFGHPRPLKSNQIQHLQPIVESRFSPFLKSSGRTLMPEPGGTNFLQFPEVENIVTGSILYSASIGHLEIISYDTLGRIATFENIAELAGSQPLSPNEFIPDCTEWILTAPTLPITVGTTTGGTGVSFLAKDYVIPMLNTTSVAVFTDTSLFQNGDAIRIDGVTLSVVEVLSTTQALLANNLSETDALREICAEENGQLVHQVALIGEQPACQNEVTELSSVIGAVDNSTCEEGIIIPTEENQILVSNAQNRFVLGSLPDVEASTTFEGCITLNPTITTYSIIVDAIDGFSEGDIVFFDCDAQSPAREFRINNIFARRFDLVPLFDVLAIELLTNNCDDCRLVNAGCCRRLEEQVNCLKAFVIPSPRIAEGVNLPLTGNDIPMADGSQVYTGNAGVAIAGVPFTGNFNSLIFENPYSCPAELDLEMVAKTTLTNYRGGTDAFLQVYATTSFTGADFTQEQPGAEGELINNSCLLGEQDDSIRNFQPSVSQQNTILVGANEIITVLYLSRFFLRSTSNANPSTMNNITASIAGVFRPQCDGSDCS